MQNHASVVIPEWPQQVLAANPQSANQKVPPSRVSTAPSTSSAPPQPQPQSSLKPPSPTPPQQQQQIFAAKKKNDISLRLTHADLLESTTPARRFENAPFVFIDSRTVELPDKLARMFLSTLSQYDLQMCFFSMYTLLTQLPDKALPSWQVKMNRSGMPLVEGLHESKFLSVLRMLFSRRECNISVYVQVANLASQNKLYIASGRSEERRVGKECPV